ncbi:class I SAM-dependent methyltransferase [Stutzerimonas tarimensis]|uniref:Class I SAM-dependent methyltransferase n=1 Tax=Stutzerimonas tarimensis TaxID=1507735 RepID=A0ABV7TAU8_9GAMM
MSFDNHFKAVSAHYASSRPSYPDALFAWLAAQCESHGLAWDCGTGSGQAALDLAERFERVLATDASPQQIACAPRHPRVDYRVALAQQSSLPARSVDLITVAQALHWFDLPAFYAEAQRVLKPGAVIVAWSYGIIQVEGEALNAEVAHFYHRVVGPYWPAERRHVETGYRELPFPFAGLEAPALAMTLDWSLAQLLDYLRSWSATARYLEARGEDPVTLLGEQLEPLWGKGTRQVRWPLAIRAGRLGRTPA